METTYSNDPLLLNLYRCCTAPGGWQAVLDRLCDEVGARSAVMQAIAFADDHQGRTTAAQCAFRRRPGPPALCHLARKAGHASLDAARAPTQALVHDDGTQHEQGHVFHCGPSRKAIGDAYARRIADRPESVRCAATQPDATIP
ncbi:hypothetical protein ACQUJS_15000 [Ralstonia pseudosolanacearum]|uniref:hypothetical protein n=1 Tax=Ralstonia pseudosolanacearum TaxID=1310165 RepID=UPI0007C8A9A1|nr:hypothetical protein [Ralstonia pseudosolanacearum]OAI76073.1 hypothetical protein RSP799_21935 [Ralstonia solanacearum]